MAKKNTKRKIIGLVTRKNTQNTPEKLSLRKYNPKTRKHEVFTETKKSLGRNEVKPRKG